MRNLANLIICNNIREIKVLILALLVLLLQLNKNYQIAVLFLLNS